MKNCSLTTFAVVGLSFTCASLAISQENKTKKDTQQTKPPKKVLRIIAFGAHPDDAEFQIGGCAAKWAELGHKVKTRFGHQW